MGAALVAHRIVFDPRELTEDPDHEQRIVLEVPLPQSSWLAPETETPFEARALHPARGLAEAPGMEIKCGTDSNHKGDVELGKVLGHEFFLFGCAQSNPHDVGVRGMDGLPKLCLFIGVQGAEGRLECARDLEFWETLEQAAAQFFGDTVGSPIEEMAVTSVFGQGEDGEHQVRTVHTFDLFEAAQAPDPDQGHAIGSAKKGAIENSAEFRV